MPKREKVIGTFLEKATDEALKALRGLGIVVQYFGPKLVLDSAHYPLTGDLPDFRVILIDGSFVEIECKNSGRKGACYCLGRNNNFFLRISAENILLRGLGGACLPPASPNKTPAESEQTSRANPNEQSVSRANMSPQQNP